MQHSSEHTASATKGREPWPDPAGEPEDVPAPAFSPLPGLGDWDGPTFGRLGVLDDDGTTVECHMCGRRYRALARHIWSAHGATPEEYRAIFGLRVRTGLTSTALKERHRAFARERFPPYWGEVAAERIRSMDPEAKAKRERLRQFRLETRLDPRVREVWSEAAQRLRECPPPPRRQFVCRVCGAPFTRSATWKGHRVCSTACERALRQRLATEQPVTRREDVRAKVASGRRRRQGDYEETVARLRALAPVAFEVLPEEDRALVWRYYGLLDGHPVSRQRLTTESGHSEWHVRQALARSVARLLERPPTPPAVATCPTCGNAFPKVGKQRYCSHTCAVRAASRHPGQCRACGRPFLGPRRQPYCSPQCGASVRGGDWRTNVRSSARRRGRPYAAELQGLDPAAFATLPSRERAMVRAFYGLDGGEPMTHREIGEAWHVSHDRVGPLVARAVAQLLGQPANTASC